MPRGQCALTIILTDPCEMDCGYLDLYFRALREWNGDAIGETQVICISQHQQDPLPSRRIAESQPFPVHFAVTNHPIVGGYPIWDTLAAVRSVWPLVRGRHVTFHHPEFIWGPGRLKRTIQYLRESGYYLALGNLRRPGLLADIKGREIPYEDCDKDFSDILSDAMDSDMEYAAEVFEELPSTHWMFMAPDPDYGRVDYIEDIFYADKEWLDAWGFIRHGGELPFQDVYDLFGMAMKNIFVKFKLRIPCHRMTQETNRMMHVHHKKEWRSWTPEIRDWFMAQPRRWRDTRFLDRDVWDAFIAQNGQFDKNGALKNNFRHVPGGTVTRYGLSMSEWLQRGGASLLRTFYDRHGKYRRSQHDNPHHDNSQNGAEARFLYGLFPREVACMEC